MWKDYFRKNRRRRTTYNYNQNYTSTKSNISRAKLIATVTKVSFVVLIVGMLIVLISIPLIARDLPSPDGIVRKNGFSSKIVDRNGLVLYDVYSDQNRTPVNLSAIPEYLRKGTISIEDKNFYKNNGFDLTGIIRGAISTLFRGQIASGSTLTQQLVKNVLLTSDQTIIRKFKEFILTAE